VENLLGISHDLYFDRLCSKIIEDEFLSALSAGVDSPCSKNKWFHKTSKHVLIYELNKFNWNTYITAIKQSSKMFLHFVHRYWFVDKNSRNKKFHFFVLSVSQSYSTHYFKAIWIITNIFPIRSHLTQRQWCPPWWYHLGSCWIFLWTRPGTCWHGTCGGRGCHCQPCIWPPLAIAAWNTPAGGNLKRSITNNVTACFV